MSEARPFYGVALSPDGSFCASVGSDSLEIIDRGSDGIRIPGPTGFGQHWGLQPPLCFSEDERFLFWGHPLLYVNLATHDYTFVEGKQKVLGTITSLDSSCNFALDFNPGRAHPRLTYLDPELSVAYLITNADDELQPLPSCAAITPDNRRVVICGTDHRIEVWNIEQLEGFRSLLGQTRSDEFTFSADSRHLLARRGENYTLWNCADGAAVYDPNIILAVRSEAESRAKASAGETAASGVRMLDRSPFGTLSAALPRGKYGEYSEPDEPGGWPVSFDPTDEAGRVVRFNGHSLPVYAGVIFPDGGTAATAGQGRVIRVWDLATGKERFLLRGHTDTINALAVSPDRERPWLLSCSSDLTARVWDFRRGVLVATFTADRRLLRAGISPDGRTFVAGQGTSGLLHLLRLEPSALL